MIDGAGFNYTVKVAANRAVTLKNLRLDSAGRTSPAGTATFDNRGTAHLDTVHVVGSLGLKNAYGGVHNDTGALLFMENCVVGGNEGVNMGGGISNFGGLVVKNSTIYGNQGNNGGGFYNYGGTAAVIGSSISNNHADDEGGGYFRISGPGTVSIFPSSPQPWMACTFTKIATNASSFDKIRLQNFPRARARSSCWIFRDPSVPTKSVRADLGRLISSSQWILLSWIKPSSIPTGTCVERPWWRE